LFSSTVVGLILLLVGLEIALSGLQSILNEPGTLIIAIAAGAALLLTYKMGNPLTKTLAPLVAFVAAGIIGRIIQHPATTSFPWFGFPGLPQTSFAFRFDLMLPFLAVAVAAGIRTLGGVRILHQDTYGDGSPRIAPGIRSDASATVLCGLAGSIGTCVALNSIPTERAAGPTPLGVSWVVAVVFILVALCPALLGFVVMAPGCAIGPLLIYYGILMAIPGVEEIRKDRALPGFAWQAGIPLGLAAVAFIHQESLHFGAKPWPPMLESLTGSLMTVGVASALIVRICLQIRRKKA